MTSLAGARAGGHVSGNQEVASKLAAHHEALKDSPFARLVPAFPRVETLRHELPIENRRCRATGRFHARVLVTAARSLVGVHVLA